ncbi:MAG: hypothetical protein IKA09_07110 [Lachnospiraceae bacterium]|nr:hypothetical protein [Lachnospiraceae bacterium]
MIYSNVVVENGIPVLKINGEKVPENAYVTYFTEKACYSDFAKAGYALYSVPIFFATRGIQERNIIPPFADGIYEKEEADFSIADKAIEQILEACPDAYIFPRVNITLPLRWEEENPDELCDTGHADPNKKRPCFSSDKWAEETKKYLGMFFDHIEKAHYRDRIFGYQLATGNTEEWFSFDLVGSIGKRSREKFQEYVEEKQLEATEELYYAFLSEMTARRICEFADFTKEKTGHRLVVGSFYGYTFETPFRTAVHAALGTVLASKSIDFLCSPISYMLGREAGIDHPCMLPLDSLKKHGKLYFVENDSRTHLSGPLFDVPHFYNPVWMSRDKWLTVENIKLHYARALIHAHALWWFDMGGGWYRYPLYMDMFTEFLKITKEAMNRDMSSVSEVAVIVDEAVIPFINEERQEDAKRTCYGIRKVLGLMGTPYDSYLAEDYQDIKDKYKAFILLVPRMSPAMKQIADENHNCLVITPQNASIKTEELREYCRSRGVHIYSEKDAVIFVNKSYLFLHTASVGRAELSIPQGIELKQRYGEEIDIERTELPRYTGYLFEVRKKFQ